MVSKAEGSHLGVWMLNTNEGNPPGNVLILCVLIIFFSIFNVEGNTGTEGSPLCRRFIAECEEN